MRDMEAHVEVAHAVAFPGVDPAAPHFQPWIFHRNLRPSAHLRGAFWSLGRQAFLNEKNP
jgi:hypothetical protein